jgi:flagellar biosynthesis/type III secretory pathway chaperone
MNKSKTKKKKVMSDKALTKLLKQEQEKISKFKYMVRKDKTMKKCHNFCKNDYLPEQYKKNPVTVKSFKSEKDKKKIAEMRKSFEEMVERMCRRNFCNEGCVEGYDFNLFSGNVKENLQKNFKEKFSKKLYHGFVDSYSAKEVEMLKKRGALSGCGDQLMN